jgi:hypothetical protein
MLALVITASLFIGISSKKAKNIKNQKLKPVSTDIEANKEGCYDAYNALVKALTVNTGGGEQGGGEQGGGEQGGGEQGGGEQGGGEQGGGEQGGGEQGGGEQGGGEQGGGGRQYLPRRVTFAHKIQGKRNIYTQAASDPLGDFVKQCPTTYNVAACKKAYVDLGGALQVASNDIKNAFVKDCKVDAPVGSGDFSILGIQLNNMLLMLVITLTGIYFSN